MYKYSNGQISLSDFKQPVGMNLKDNNRWVKKAQRIPWNEIEHRYAALFTNNKGNVAKSLRLALGACIIQAEYGFSDMETALEIQENPYLQYFCGYSGYDDEHVPFDASTMVYFRKRLTAEILGEINEMILRKIEAPTAPEVAIEEPEKSDDDDSEQPPSGGENQGTMIMDATCAPANIKYPQDASLLNEAREQSEKIIDKLHISGNKKPRTYRKNAHKDYLKLVRTRKPGAKKIRKAIGKQLGYLSRNLKHIEGLQSQNHNELSERETERLETIRKVFAQQKSMYDSRTHSVADRIVSISQPWIRPIIRGKAGKPVEFGMKLDISVVNGYARLEHDSFDAYNESGQLQGAVERYFQRTGHYPERILADKIYRNRSNLAYCQERGIRLAGPALGRPKKDAVVDKKQNYKDECERVEVERAFSLAKLKCGLGRIFTKLEETSRHSVALSILVLNLRRIQCAVFRLLTFWADALIPRKICWLFS